MFTSGQRVKIVSQCGELQGAIVTIKGPALSKDGRELTGWWSVKENPIPWCVSELAPVVEMFEEEILG